MKSANPSEDGGPGEIQTGPLSTQAWRNLPSSNLTARKHAEPTSFQLTCGLYGNSDFSNTRNP
jgi:hypothetical protein